MRRERVCSDARQVGSVLTDQLNNSTGRAEVWRRIAAGAAEGREPAVT
jgi:hypothetical protein